LRVILKKLIIEKKMLSFLNQHYKKQTGTLEILVTKSMCFNDRPTTMIHPLPPSDAVRKQKKNIPEDLSTSVLSQFKKYHPSRNLFNNLGIFKSLKLRNFIGIFFRISPNFFDFF